MSPETLPPLLALIGFSGLALLCWPLLSWLQLLGLVLLYWPAAFALLRE